MAWFKKFQLLEFWDVDPEKYKNYSDENLWKAEVNKFWGSNSRFYAFFSIIILVMSTLLLTAFVSIKNEAGKGEDYSLAAFCVVLFVLAYPLVWTLLSLLRASSFQGVFDLIWRSARTFLVSILFLLPGMAIGLMALPFFRIRAPGPGHNGDHYRMMLSESLTSRLIHYAFLVSASEKGGFLENLNRISAAIYYRRSDALDTISDNDIARLDALWIVYGCYGVDVIIGAIIPDSWHSYVYPVFLIAGIIHYLLVCAKGTSSGIIWFSRIQHEYSSNPEHRREPEIEKKGSYLLRDGAPFGVLATYIIIRIAVIAIIPLTIFLY